MPDHGTEGALSARSKIKIALVTFAFDNAKVINWLRERGDCIKIEDWKGLAKMNETIGQALANDQELLDKMQRPCAAFITFETEEGHCRAVAYNNVIERYEEFSSFEYRLFLDRPIKIQAASEPSDIIWENRGFTVGERSAKKSIVVTIIVAMLLLSFGLIFFL